jgi:sec-independent protein translocase protein TatA
MFNSIGVPELLIVLVILLLVFGPKRLPGLGKQLGSGMREFKDSVSGKSRGDDDDDDEDEVATGRDARRRRRTEAALGRPEGEQPAAAETPVDGEVVTEPRS